MSSQRSSLMSLWDLLSESPVSRVLAIAVLVLFFLAPIDWIAELVQERMLRRDQAVGEVSGKWGGTQQLTGPLLVVPFEHRWSEPLARGGEVTKSEIRTLTILPTELTVQARLEGEERFRGIFSVPVYRSVLDVSGTFAVPDLDALRIDPALVDWKRADLVLGIADAHAIQNRAALRWNDVERPFQSGTGDSQVRGGIHAPVEPAPTAGPARFAFQLILNGSSGLYFTPVGEQTTVTVESNWPDPSFQGSWLPGERSADASGFRATWRIPFLGRNQPPAWTSATSNMIDKVNEAVFGVDLVTPVDTYRMAERSVKYARLFVLLTFGVIWLVEVVGGVRVHPMQYLLIGCALCTFYLLELSLAEQLGFAVAYAIAATAVVALIGAYAVVALRGWQRAVAVVATVGGLYGYLYVVLTNEDYALLLGSLGVFTAVAVAMLLTRHIDWYASGGAAAAPPASVLDTP